MASDTPSRGAVTFTWLVLVLVVVLLVWGAIKYGISLDIQQRFWSDIFARFGGPMTFRFFSAADHGGNRCGPRWPEDAREGHRVLLLDRDGGTRHSQTGRLREGIISTARIMLLGISMDVIYQFKELDVFYPAEAVVIAILLAVIPYFIFRWIVEWIARRWMHHGRPAQ